MTHDTGFKRNEAVGLDLGWVNQIKVNRNASDRRAASLANRRTVKKEYQAAWLIKALQCIDLTTLGGDDTPGRVERLCMKALRPLRTDLMEALGVSNLTDEEPPLSNGNFGFDSGVHANLFAGRTWSIELNKEF